MSKRRTPGPFIRIGTPEFIIDDGEYGLPEQSGPQSEPQSESSKRVERTWTSKRLIGAAFDLLQEKHPKKYSNGFAGAKPTDLRNQAKSIWPKVCEAENVSPEDYPLLKWDSFKRERDRRVALGREHDRRRD